MEETTGQGAPPPGRIGSVTNKLDPSRSDKPSSLQEANCASTSSRELVFRGVAALRAPAIYFIPLDAATAQKTLPASKRLLTSMRCHGPWHSVAAFYAFHFRLTG